VAEELAKKGIDVEIIDPRTLVPLDKDTIIKSVKKTGKLLIVDEGYERCGVAAEIAMSILSDVFYYLDAPIERLTTANFPLSFSPALEFLIIRSGRVSRACWLPVEVWAMPCLQPPPG